MNEEKSVGYLVVRVSTAGGAIPIENAVVIVRGYDVDSEVFHSLTTDRSGLTERLELSAPSQALTLSPEVKESPFTPYSIDVYCEGYYPQYYVNVPIFEGIVAIQDARIIPLSEPGGADIYSRGEQVFNERGGSQN